MGWLALRGCRYVEQDLPECVVGEIDGVETDLDLAVRQGLRAGRIDDFARRVQQVEHALDVGQRLSDFAIDDAEEVERHVELDQEGVDQHEIADGQRTGEHAGSRATSSP